MRLLNFIKRNYNSKLNNNNKPNNPYSKNTILDGIVTIFAITFMTSCVLENKSSKSNENK